MLPAKKWSNPSVADLGVAAERHGKWVAFWKTMGKRASERCAAQTREKHSASPSTTRAVAQDGPFVQLCVDALS